MMLLSRNVYVVAWTMLSSVPVTQKTAVRGPFGELLKRADRGGVAVVAEAGCWREGMAFMEGFEGELSSETEYTSTHKGY